MSGTTMVFLIVLVSIIGGTLNNWISSKKKIAKSAMVNANDDTIKALEERVATLERIVTDKGTMLRDEIDAL